MVNLPPTMFSKMPTPISLAIGVSLQADRRLEVFERCETSSVLLDVYLKLSNDP